MCSMMPGRTTPSSSSGPMRVLPKGKEGEQVFHDALVSIIGFKLAVIRSIEIIDSLDQQ